jgi:hypothetical protein
VSGFVSWIAAEGKESDLQKSGFVPLEDERGVGEARGERTAGKFSSLESSLSDLPAHNFPGRSGRAESGGQEETALDRNPEIWLYRKLTMALLRRYMRFSVETGRLPSIVGRQMFRSRVTQYSVTTFEDRVIFVRDVERCLERLGRFDQKIIARVVLEDYSHERAAVLLGMNRTTLERRLFDVIDELSERFLEDGLLLPVPDRGKRENPQ